MKSLLFSLLFAVSAIARAQSIPVANGDYCKDDIANYVALRFGPETKITKMFHANGAGGIITHYFWYQVDACAGDIVAVFRGEGFQCQSVQYGSRTQLLTFTYARTKDCQRFIPGDDYIDLYQ